MKIKTVKDGNIIRWKETQDFKELAKIEYRDTELYQYGDDVVIDHGSYFSVSGRKQKPLTELLYKGRYNIRKNGSFSFIKSQIVIDSFWKDEGEPESYSYLGNISNSIFNKWTDREIKL